MVVTSSFLPATKMPRLINSSAERFPRATASAQNSAARKGALYQVPSIFDCKLPSVSIHASLLWKYCSESNNSPWFCSVSLEFYLGLIFILNKRHNSNGGGVFLFFSLTQLHKTINTCCVCILWKDILWKENTSLHICSHEKYTIKTAHSNCSRQVSLHNPKLLMNLQDGPFIFAIDFTTVYVFHTL